MNANQLKSKKNLSFLRKEVIGKVSNKVKSGTGKNHLTTLGTWSPAIQ